MLFALILMSRVCVRVCICVQVRCAAVFALGTFVGNSAERTDHSTTIDHNVAMMLAQLINDGSPVVRKVTPRSPFLLYEDRRRMPNATACVCRRDAGLSVPVENVFSCVGKENCLLASEIAETTQERIGYKC